MRNRVACLICCALVAMSVPASAQAPAAAKVTIAESARPNSNVGIAVEPTLSDGRLIVKVAAKNLGGAPVRFGPSTIGIAKAAGEAIAISPLSSLVEDVRMAAGLGPELAPATAPTQGAYAAPQQDVRDGGRMDVTGFTGGSAVGRDEHVRRSRSSRKVKPSISEAAAAQQIAVLNQAILQDSILAPGQVAAGQVISEKLRFARNEDRTLHLRVRVAGEEHAFTVAAPKE